MKKLILICTLLMFTMPTYAWQEGIIDDGTWKKQTVKVKDMQTGETKRIKYRIYGINRDRIKVYEDGEIKKYRIERR